MAFDVEGAKAAGYSEAEIADHLATAHKFDAAAARTAGYSDADLIKELATREARPPEDKYAIGNPAGDQGGTGGADMPQDGVGSAIGGVVNQATSGVARAVAGVAQPVHEVVTSPDAMGRIGEAVAEGWRGSVPGSPSVHNRESPFVLQPQTVEALRRNDGPLGYLGGALGTYGTVPLLKGAEAVLSGANALAQGGQQAILETAKAAGYPGLDRDINALMNTLPFTAPFMRFARRGPEPGAPAPPSPQFVSERVAPPRPEGATDASRILQLVEHGVNEEQPAVGPPLPRGPATAPKGSGGINGSDGTDAGWPRPVGADVTPSAVARLTEQQELEYGSTADKQWLFKTFHPGEAIPDEFIPGITPTAAQYEQTAIRARETKAARNLSKEAEQAERELLDEHNTKRKDFFQQTAGSDVTQGIAIRQADEAIDQELTAAFRSGRQADPSAIMEAIKAEREAPGAKLPPVKAVLNAVEEAMQKLDGSGLETDPRQIWGVRRTINFLQSKYGIAENPAIGHPDVQAALVRIKEVLDRTNEDVAPGFTGALKNYSEAQRAIEANEVMQAAESNLYDSLGRMQFSRMHKFMSDAIKSRDPRAGINPYKSLNPKQMARLKSLHDDLMRVASAEDLAKARGSDTAPNFMDAVKQAAKGATGQVAAGVIGSAVGGVPGAVASAVAQNRIAAAFDRRAERRAGQDMDRLLRPDPALYPTRLNPMLNPDAPP